jgi:acetylornithine deacetylase
VSAVAVAARCVAFLDDILGENMANPVPDVPFDPPFTTVHTGMIAGGVAHNVVASDCSFVTDVRALPGEDPHAVMARYRAFVAERIEPAMKRVDPATGVSITVRADVPGLAPGDDDRAEALCRRLTGDNGVHGVAFGTEAGQYRAGGGWPVVICGPGSIDQAHQPDEFISAEQFDGGVAFARRLIADLAR